MLIPLSKICHARSGDKGDTANIGLNVRKPEYYTIIETSEIFIYCHVERSRNMYSSVKNTLRLRSG